eukprot:GHVS01008819.1.p1 GENE.GHVS01008819.1~~GHVS01008819.1.p1  ORF type:complete len:470 (-),score=56.39 GHVS01008819.1:19-1428(-)
MGNSCLGKPKSGGVRDSDAPSSSSGSAATQRKSSVRKSPSRTLSQLLRRSMSFMAPDSTPTDILAKLRTYRPLLVDHVTSLIEKDVFAQTIDDESLRNLGVLLAWPSVYANGGGAVRKVAAQKSGDTCPPIISSSGSEEQRCIDSVVQALESDFKSKESKFSIARISKSGPFKRGSCVGYCEVQLVMFVNDAEPPFDNNFMTAVKKSLWKLDSKKVVIKGLKSAAESPAYDGAMCISAVLNECVDLAILAAPNYGSGQLQLRNTLDRMQTSHKPNAFIPALCEQHSTFVSSIWSELHANGQAMVRLCRLWVCTYDLKLLSQWSIECLAMYIALCMRHTKPLDAQLSYFFHILNAIAKSKLSGGYTTTTTDSDCDVPYPAAVWWKDKDAQSNSLGSCAVNTMGNNCVLGISRSGGNGTLKVLDPVAGNVDLFELVPRPEWSRIEKLSAACSLIMQKCTDRTLIEIFSVKQ